MSGDSVSVGIIANPFSGKDIRRLVGYGATSDNLNKVRVLQRVLVGVAEAGVDRVLYMPDPFQLVPEAFRTLRAVDRGSLVLESVLETVRGEPAESERSAAAMQAAGVGAIVTMGGDGTNRLVALGAGATPLLPLAVGTNNVFPLSLEPTVAGLAAGFVARRRDGVGCRREKALRVRIGDETDFALTDVAWLHGTYHGAGAVWHPDALRELVVTQGGVHLIGLAAIAGRATPVDRAAAGGAYVRFGPGRRFRAPIAPGRFSEISVSDARHVDFGQPVPLTPGPGVLAFDGERLRTVPAGLRPEVEVSPDGPVVIDPISVLSGH